MSVCATCLPCIHGRLLQHPFNLAANCDKLMSIYRHPSTYALWVPASQSEVFIRQSGTICHQNDKK